MLVLLMDREKDFTKSYVSHFNNHSYSCVICDSFEELLKFFNERGRNNSKVEALICDTEIGGKEVGPEIISELVSRGVYPLGTPLIALGEHSSYIEKWRNNALLRKVPFDFYDKFVFYLVGPSKIVDLLREREKFIRKDN